MGGTRITSLSNCVLTFMVYSNLIFIFQNNIISNSLSFKINNLISCNRKIVNRCTTIFYRYFYQLITEKNLKVCLSFTTIFSIDYLSFCHLCRLSFFFKTMIILTISSNNRNSRARIHNGNFRVNRYTLQ